jgi:hypothetical protein
MFALGRKRSFTGFLSGKSFSPKLEKGKRVGAILMGGSLVPD